MGRACLRASGPRQRRRIWGLESEGTTADGRGILHWGDVGELDTDVRVLPADMHGDCGRGKRHGQEAGRVRELAGGRVVVDNAVAGGAVLSTPWWAEVEAALLKVPPLLTTMDQHACSGSQHRTPGRTCKIMNTMCPNK